MTFTTWRAHPHSAATCHSNPETGCPAKPLTSLGFLSSKDPVDQKMAGAMLPPHEWSLSRNKTHTKQAEPRRRWGRHNTPECGLQLWLPWAFQSEAKEWFSLHKLLGVKFLSGTERWLAHSVISANSEKGFNQIGVLNHTRLFWKFSCLGASSFCFVLFNFGFRQGFVN